ncbi:MAG: SPFH domain-containing protein, partial [Ktedonobacteraceae bacterium]|nr:SPFH domain-containing protein [Ktedonobacteraceae bacterium]
LVARGGVSVPADSWPIILVLLMVVVVVQSVATYFAGSNAGLRALATVGGFCLFLLVGSFAIFGLATCLTLLIIMIVLAIAGARFYFHPVGEGTVDIVYAVGKYRRTLYPGINILLPWEKIAHHVKVSETQWLCPMQRVQLSRNEDVHLRAIISYQLMPEDAHLAATQVKNWEESLREYFLACLQNIATTFTPEDFIAWPQGLRTPPSEIEQASSLARRELVNRYLFAQMRDRVAIWGVEVKQVNVRDVVLAPHDSTIIEVAPPSAPAQEAQGAPEVTRPAPVMQVSLHQMNDRPKQVNNSPKQVADAPKMEKPPEPVEPSNDRVVPPRALSEEVLKKVYKEVQDGKITDPSTIREIAARFQQVADDPQASQMVSFDAERAALNLYEQARRYEERHYRNDRF